MKPLILIGGGGHCRSAIDVIRAENKFEIIGITDRKEKIGDSIDGVEIITEDRELEGLIPKYSNCLVTVGQLKNPGLRIKLFEMATGFGASFPTIISPNGVVSTQAEIGEGTILFHRTVVNAGSTIGKNCIINTGAIIEHDVTIGDHTHISPGSIVNGHCKIGSRTLIGSGSVVIQQVSIGDDIVVGANSTVVEDLMEPGVYVGSPAKRIEIPSSPRDPAGKRGLTNFSIKIMNRITLFTVVYPGCEPYLARFFRSVREQEFDQFDLLILNDGLKNLQQFAGDLWPRIDDVPVSGTIAEVRRKGLQLLMDRPADKIVFADADDYISPDRVQKANAALEQFDIYVNDLTTVTRDEKPITKNYLRHRLGAEFEISSEFILEKNVMGLGNTSVRKSALQDLPIPPDTIAVDWMIFTDMLLRGLSAIFKSEAESFYRQHDQNTAGLKNISAERIRRALNVQIQNASFFKGQSDLHKIHLEKLLEIKSFLVHKDENFSIYTDKVKEQLSEYPLWWEEIRTLDRLLI